MGSLRKCVSHGWQGKCDPLYLANCSFLKSCYKSFMSPALAVSALITLDCDCLGPSPHGTENPAGKVSSELSSAASGPQEEYDE